jgi:CheY-like chemotaxis protein
MPAVYGTIPGSSPRADYCKRLLLLPLNQFLIIARPTVLFLLSYSMTMPQERAYMISSDVIDTRSAEEITASVQAESCSWVIVAEDDETLRFLLGEALSQEGFEVLPAANGREALDLYRRNADKVSLAIVDVCMPEMDGVTAAIEMRKIDANVFFLFMSGYDCEHLKEQGFSLESIPNADFLPKPFAFKDMMGRIRMLGLLAQRQSVKYG